MSAPTQDYRPVRLATVLAKDELLFASLTALERLNEPFEYHLKVLSLNPNLDFKPLIATPMSVCLDLPENRQRYFNGLVSHCRQSGEPDAHNFFTYYIELRPWLWFLSRYAECRFFQDKSIPDIVQDIFDDRGFKDYDLSKLNRGDYPQHEYCAQYRESDLNFVSRRFEQEGIVYFFEHTEDGKHTLWCVDEPADHSHAPGFATLPFARSFQGTQELLRESVYELSLSHSAQPSAYALNSFYFEQPSDPLYSLVKPEALHPNLAATVYDYPGPDNYRDTDKGRRYAKMRLEELHTEQVLIEAKTNAMGLAVGKTFTLTEHPREDLNQEYLLTASRIKLAVDPYESGAASEPSFSCQFSAQQADQPFRPPRRTPVPAVQGPQTAIVVPEEGQESEEISTDKHGRIKVRFHWNQSDHNLGGKHQQERSCWIRVSHPWAGKNWGAVAIPRIGQEVIIDFEEGDPDLPICTGRVYNGEQKHPYDLPAGKNTSGIKSDSTKGGGGYNEIAMDDTKNKELIRIHAQYDMDTTVEHDDRQTVHNNRTINVDGTHTETIIKDTKITISEGNYEHKVNTGTGTYFVKGAVKEDYDNKQETTVTNEIVTKSKTSHIHLTAATEIKLEVGSSTLLMKADGSIKLSGVNVAIDGKASVNIHGASVTSQADADHNTKGSIVISEGAASNTVKGGMVMLNP